jgi:myosin heavy chain 6/7
MKPKLKVGKDFVKKGQNLEQVAFAISATSKSLFARMFDWVVALVNDSLDTPNPRKNFIGVLDIAGFEIFELNVLEQLLINYTNERLQQFFNHHMFVQEQEEYKAEGIQWAFVDFGMDLVVTIELIEKKMGILAMLEEECIVPKATDKTYLEKMMGKHLGKHKSFGKPKPAKKGKPEAHFEVHHYAGTVGYNVTGWLFKNKDPVNDAVIGMMAGAGNAVCATVFMEKDDGTKKKGSSMMTISAAHRESLHKLMTNLHSTHPHFVRCIIPNEIKKSGYIDAPLVMHQLNCNGVLEGIRICMLGLPNKVPHADFMSRYSIIAPKTFADMASDAKGCASKSLVEVGLDADEFRCGHTKIMFRAGRLSKLEEIREASLTKIVLKMQCTARVVLMKLSKYNDLKQQKNLLSSIQRNIKIYYAVRGWGWFQFYTTVKGEMGKILAKMAEEARKKAMAEGLAKIEGMLAGRIADREAVEAINGELAAKKAGLAGTIEGMGSVALADLESIKAAEELANEAQKKLNALLASSAKEKAALQAEFAETKATLTAEKEAAAATLSAQKATLEGAIGNYNAQKAGCIGMESGNAAGKGDVLLIMDDIAKLDKIGTSLLRDKKEMLAAIGSTEKMVWTHGRLATLLNA